MKSVITSFQLSCKATPEAHRRALQWFALLGIRVVRSCSHGCREPQACFAGLPQHLKLRVAEPRFGISLVLLLSHICCIPKMVSMH